MIVYSYFGWKFDFTLAKFPGEMKTKTSARTTIIVHADYLTGN